MAIARKRLVALAAGLCLGFGATGHAQDYQSALMVLPGCQQVVAKVAPKDLVEAAQYGRCLGTVETIFGLRDVIGGRAKFCLPAGAASIQGIRVAIKYADERPELLHLPFGKLAADAFQEAWPCK